MILLMRHPRTDAAPGLCFGRHDPALAAGWEAITDAALPALSGIGRILASPSPRCLRPARRLADALSLPLTEDPRLQELHFGAWENRRWWDIPRAESDPWAEDPETRAPPGGETFAQLRARVLAALAEADAGPPALLLTHAGPIRALWMAREGLSFAEAFVRTPPYGTPFALPAA